MACLTDIGPLSYQTNFLLGDGSDLFIIPVSATAIEQYQVPSLALLDASFAPVSPPAILYWFVGIGSSGPFYYLGRVSGDNHYKLHSTSPGGSDALVATIDRSRYSLEELAYLNPLDGLIYCFGADSADPDPITNATGGLFTVDPSDGTVTRVTYENGDVVFANDGMAITDDGAVWWSYFNNDTDQALRRWSAIDGEASFDLFGAGIGTDGIGVWWDDPTQIWVADSNAESLSVFEFTGGSISVAASGLCAFGSDPSYPYGNIAYNDSQHNADFTKFAVAASATEIWLHLPAGGWRAGLGAQSQTPGWTVTQ